MAQNFIACDREQVLLLPPSVRDWLPDDHLALFVIDAVALLDLEAFTEPVLRDTGRRRPWRSRSTPSFVTLCRSGFLRRDGVAACGGGRSV